MIVKKGKETSILYLDTFFKRFRKLYNIEESTAVKRFIDQLSNNLQKIDGSVWKSGDVGFVSGVGWVYSGTAWMWEFGSGRNICIGV